MDLALLIIRLVVGGLVAAHGFGKLAGWFGAGFGLAGTAQYLEGFGFRPGRLWAIVAGTTEAVGGVLLASGALTPLAGAAIAGTMLVAARTDHAGKGPWIFNGGWEHVTTNATVALAIVGTGPGRFSIDEVAGLELDGAAWLVGAAALAITAGALTLTLGRPAPQTVRAER